jgi:hypothetical protein
MPISGKEIAAIFEQAMTAPLEAQSISIVQEIFLMLLAADRIDDVQNESCACEVIAPTCLRSPMEALFPAVRNVPAECKLQVSAATAAEPKRTIEPEMTTESEATD